ncbi:hypothetical protein BRADI_3g03645v3 [Brachypodium distachyon]|uniref:Uncharacterized protein n=1 Tax=Brachypodium distachyon TaxID=15368 RepID=A0A0Q3F145_BRADI|nr:hypothetical protein BRADI_3g03645v3 [Brachypodium distachyon]
MLCVLRREMRVVQRPGRRVRADVRQVPSVGVRELQAAGRPDLRLPVLRALLRQLHFHRLLSSSSAACAPGLIHLDAWSLFPSLVTVTCKQINFVFVHYFPIHIAQVFTCV